MTSKKKKNGRNAKPSVGCIKNSQTKNNNNNKKLKKWKAFRKSRILENSHNL